MVKDLAPYAKALFESAVELDQESAVEADLKELDQIWKENPDYARMLEVPGINRDKKAQLVKDLLQDQVQPLVLRFFEVLCAHGMAGGIPDLYPYWQQESRAWHGIETVLVETPAPLDPVQTENLLAMLERKTGRRPELDVRIVPDLVAGLRLRYRDFVLDNTIASRVHAMQEQLLESR